MSEQKTFTDKNGKWLIDGKVDILIEPSEEWLQKRSNSESPTEPAIEEYLMDLDYRLSLKELGL